MIGLSMSDVGLLGGRIFMKLEDNFNRPNQSGLGVIPVAERSWEQLSGSWSISSNRAVAANTTNPVAVVEAYTPDVDISLSVSSTGHDGIAFRVTDKDNYLRLVNFYNRTTSPIYEVRVPHIVEIQRMVIHSPDGRVENPTIQYSYGGTFWAVAGSYSGEPTGWRSEITHQGLTRVRTVTQQTSGSTRIVAVGTRTSTTRRVHLQKVENGRVTNLHTFSPGTTSSLRVVANGNNIQVYSNGSLRHSRTESFNNFATKHGITRGTSVGGRGGSALDNFSLTPTILQ